MEMEYHQIYTQCRYSYPFVNKYIHHEIKDFVKTAVRKENDINVKAVSLNGSSVY